VTEPARTAPVTASSTIEIDAEPGVVRGLLVDVERRPDWSPDVRDEGLRALGRAAESRP
jgi:hypothetical protein